MNNPLISVENLSVIFKTDEGDITAVDQISFTIDKRETVGIVGESGSGKSVTSKAIMGLIRSPGVIDKKSRIQLNAIDLITIPEKQMEKIRGNHISMIFQEPMTSLNPVFKIGDQISEVMMIHGKVDKKSIKAKTIGLIEKVGIPRAEKVYDEYPHSLSGGMRQRVMIAMALACEPQLLIADEPTTALDVTIQAQILFLLEQLRKEMDTSILFISHDMGVISEICDRVLVMYCGRIVEEGPIDVIFNHAMHPYTVGLLKCIPREDSDQKRLNQIPGTVPNPRNLPLGCKFEPRCDRADANCKRTEPDLLDFGNGHKVRCHAGANRIK